MERCFEGEEDDDARLALRPLLSSRPQLCNTIIARATEGFDRRARAAMQALAVSLAAGTGPKSRAAAASGATATAPGTPGGTLHVSDTVDAQIDALLAEHGLLQRGAALVAMAGDASDSGTGPAGVAAARAAQIAVVAAAAAATATATADALVLSACIKS